jgi:hypothetical protein
MAHFDGDGAKLSAALAIVEEAPHFGFHRGGVMGMEDLGPKKKYPPYRLRAPGSDK